MQQKKPNKINGKKQYLKKYYANVYQLFKIISSRCTSDLKC